MFGCGSCGAAGVSGRAGEEPPLALWYGIGAAAQQRGSRAREPCRAAGCAAAGRKLPAKAGGRKAGVTGPACRPVPRAGKWQGGQQTQPGMDAAAQVAMRAAGKDPAADRRVMS